MNISFSHLPSANSTERPDDGVIKRPKQFKSQSKIFVTSLVVLDGLIIPYKEMSVLVSVFCPTSTICFGHSFRYFVLNIINWTVCLMGFL
jgi:hypothetical protein